MLYKGTDKVLWGLSEEEAAGCDGIRGSARRYGKGLVACQILELSPEGSECFSWQTALEKHTDEGDAENAHGVPNLE